MAIYNVGPSVTQQSLSGALTQMVATLDLFKNREQAMTAILAQTQDADLVALGFAQYEVTFLRNGMAALDSMVTQGLANTTIKTFTDRVRNYQQ